MVNEFSTDEKGIPTGILLREIPQLQERLTVFDKGYILVRWEQKFGVWQVNHVYTLGLEAATVLKTYIP